MSLAEGRNTPQLAEGGKVLVLPVAAGTVIYEGSLIVLDANGYAKPGTKAVDLTAAGRAEEFVDNSGGTAGAVKVKVKRGVFIWDNTSVAANKIKDEHVLKDCYILDDCTVTALATGSSKAGKVIAVTDDGVAVETL